ncbi:MAG: M1 family metallopeptidase [Gammaproteobacteria bacterium]
MRMGTMTLAFAGAFLLAAAASATPVSETSMAASASAPATAGIPTGQLPTDVQPLAYTLDFTMNPAQPTYRGHEQITIRIAKSLDTIWLHGRGIDVHKAQLLLANGKTLNVNYKQVNKAGVVKLALPQNVKPGKARLVFDFANEYSPGLLGAYTDTVDGKHYVFTQFEAIAARRAFPCFDEPRFKTPFSLSFTVPKGDKVVANTPVKKKTEVGPNEVEWQFVTTHPLPTYLIDWNIGPLDIVKGPPIPPNKLRKRPVPLYGVTVAGKGDQIRYALAHAGAIVTAEEKYYGIAYPWRKLSLIAVPDFAAGAMENAGAITFRSSLLLMDPKTAPTSEKRAFWSVAAHELGHMWTGDLVTVPWWNDIWLNEAFATWMAQKIMDELHPGWSSKLRAVDSRQAAMSADSLVSARAVRQPIKSTGDIKNAFDSITYLKGAAVISMFEHYVGPQKFREGMHNYLVAHRYGSGTLQGFLDAISKAAGENIGPAFKTFLNQPGLPMIHATLAMKDGKPVVHLAQSRYFPIGSTGNRHGEHWQIPVCMRYAAGGKVHQQCAMLTQEQADVPLDATAMPTWFMPNDENFGYYQWALGKQGYAALAKSYRQLEPTGQMSLARSIEAAFNDGSINTAEAMQELAPLAKSSHYLVAEEPMGIISFAHERLVSGRMKTGVEAWAHKLYGGYNVAAVFKPGGAPASDDQRQFDASVAEFLARTDDNAVRKAATAAADRLLGLNADGTGGNGRLNVAALAPDFIPLALSVAVQDQGKPVFDDLLKVFENAQTPFVRNASLDALASATDPALAKRVRAMALDPKALRRNEVGTVIFIQSAIPDTREATWQWLKKNYAALAKRLPGDFGGFLPRIVGNFCSVKKADAAAAFFRPTLSEHPGSRRVLTEAVERAHLCAAKRKVQGPPAETFFRPFATSVD